MERECVKKNKKLKQFLSYICYYKKQSNMNSLKYNEITKNVFAVGAEHWDRQIFDELVPLPDGTSYNSYLVVGSEKTALIDTVEPEKAADLFDHLNRLDVEKIDYIIANHAEQDHSGAIPDILDLFPDAKVVTNKKCKNMLVDLLHLDESVFEIIGDEDTLSLGDKTLKFLMTPWVHWPETMTTYLEEDKVLFSCDFFGSHRATSKLFVYDNCKVLEDAKRYYAEIMMPYRKFITKNIAKVEQYPIDYIAPSHGPIYDNPALIIDAYKDWISPRVEDKILIPYVSMHESTALMADYLVRRFTEHNINVIPFNLATADMGELAMELVDAATVIFGSPIVLNGAHPLAVSAAYLANALNPKVKHMGVFGSFGWGGKMIEQFQFLLGDLKAEFIEPVLVKGLPREEDYERLDKLVEQIVELHKSLD